MSTAGAFNDLRPGTFGTYVLNQLSDYGITPFDSPREQHPRPPIGRDHGSARSASRDQNRLATPTNDHRTRHTVTAMEIPPNG
jgi:hypothetical protein